MKITLETLRDWNRSYFMGANMLTQKDLDIANNLIDAIETSRTSTPQMLDNVDYTTKYGAHYPHAMIDSPNTYFDGLPCIVQNASAHICLRKDETLGLSSSGGSYDGQKDISKFEYVGTAERTFWTWSSEGVGAHHGIYFPATVSNFKYTEDKLPEV